MSVPDACTGTRAASGVGATSSLARSQVPSSWRRSDSSAPDPESEPSGTGRFIPPGAAVGWLIGPGAQPAAPRTIAPAQAAPITDRPNVFTTALQTSAGS